MRLFISIAAFVAALAPAAAAELTRAQFVHSVIVEHFLPRLAAFARSAPTLAKRLDALCQTATSDTLDAARAAWTETMLAWESASAIGFGPLLARRSVYRIDYWPPRDHLIIQALNKPPNSIKGLELIGAPAKGIPAIEWLLWTPADRPQILFEPTRCAYGQLLALEVADESRSLDEAFTAFAKTELPDSVASDLFAGLLNLVYGEVEQMGDKKMARPAKIGGGKNFPRVLSGQTLAAWSAQWSSLRDFLLAGGDGGTSNLETFLRAQEFAPLAQKLRIAADEVTQTLEATLQATPVATLQLAIKLRAVRTVLGDDVATALKIPVQFSVNDGD